MAEGSFSASCTGPHACPARYYMGLPNLDRVEKWSKGPFQHASDQQWVVLRSWILLLSTNAISLVYLSMRAL